MIAPMLWPCRTRSRRGPTVLGALAAGVLLLGSGVATSAGPSVAELSALCERAFAQGNVGVDAAACEWYAAPCPCKLRDAGADAPTWCIPELEGVDSTLHRVAAALRAHPDQGAPAEGVVPRILARLYPCAPAPLGGGSPSSGKR